MALPGGSLPSNLCRARPHGKGFAEPICPFAVRFWCTAKSSSPVVGHRHFLVKPELLQDQCEFPKENPVDRKTTWVVQFQR
jgi:hypothetical protein